MTTILYFAFIISEAIALITGIAKLILNEYERKTEGFSECRYIVGETLSTISFICANVAVLAIFSLVVSLFC